ncbi:MAG TPA: hypothetical protein PLD10_00755 [Rhodopila sp.]|nr:hypothetical protein [Rhodopila sp.]
MTRRNAQNGSLGLATLVCIYEEGLTPTAVMRAAAILSGFR